VALAAQFEMCPVFAGVLKILPQQNPPIADFSALYVFSEIFIVDSVIFLEQIVSRRKYLPIFHLRIHATVQT
jgi:hypothetical protein